MDEKIIEFLKSQIIQNKLFGSEKSIKNMLHTYRKNLVGSAKQRMKKIIGKNRSHVLIVNHDQQEKEKFLMPGMFEKEKGSSIVLSSNTKGVNQVRKENVRMKDATWMQLSTSYK